jgi:hypothetical protein
MSVKHDDITVQNVDPVPMASGDMPLSVIDDIERRASATATTLQASGALNSDAGNEARLAGDMAMELSSGGLLKMGAMAVEVLGDRMDAGKTSLSSPITGKTDGIMGGLVQTMDQMMSPGDATSGKQSAHRGMSGEEVIMGANIAESSLLGQDKESVGTWAVNSAKVDGVSLAKRLTFDKVYQNQHAMDSVPAARAQYQSTMHTAMQMSPGMSPSANMSPSAMLKAAEDHNEEMSRWRDRSDGSWS